MPDNKTSRETCSAAMIILSKIFATHHWRCVVILVTLWRISELFFRINAFYHHHTVETRSNSVPGTKLTRNPEEKFILSFFLSFVSFWSSSSLKNSLCIKGLFQRFLRRTNNSLFYKNTPWKYQLKTIVYFDLSRAKFAIQCACMM